MSIAVPAAEPAASESPWAPLAAPRYRMLWIAGVASDIGGAMQGVGAGWTMTTLSSSPFAVAMVQAASMLPMFLLLLPAGALADIVDRRKLLIASESWSLLAAFAMGFVALTGSMTPTALLVLTFMVAIGAALGTPGFQAVVPELVPKEQVPAAAALSSLGVNIARAVGPAIAGLVISLAGVAAVFLLNAATFLATISALWMWRRREKRSGDVPPEHFFPALRVGWRYAVRNPRFLTVLLRSAAFFTFASALWALLPLVGKEKLGGSPYGYSILLSCLGLGAIAAAFSLQRLRVRIGPNRLVIAASLVYAAAMAAAALSDRFAVVAACMLAGGWAWLTCVTSLNVSARFAVANWVMARGLAMNQMVFFGCSALGAAFWGWFAEVVSIDAALIAGAAGVAIASASGYRFRLERAPHDLEPTRHWALPHAELSAPQAERPVLVSVEYRVRRGQTDAFIEAMHALEPLRLRNGAVGWRLYGDVEDPQRFVEHFLEISWHEHLRHHDRTTAEDRSAEEKVGLTLDDGESYKVSHLSIAS